MTTKRLTVVKHYPDQDRLEEQFDQLAALLAVASGDEFGTFNANIISDYMMNCEDKLKALRGMVMDMLGGGEA